MKRESPATSPITGPQSSVASRLLRGASWSLLAQLLPVVTSIVLTPFLVHHLGLDLFGLSVLATTVVGFLRTFDGGLGGTATRFFAIQAGADRRDQTTRLLLSLVAIVCSVGGLLALIAELLAPTVVRSFVSSPSLRDQGIFQLRVLIVLVIGGVITGLFSSVLVARQRFAWLSIVSVVGTVLTTVGYVVLLDGGHKLRAVALVNAAQVLLSAVLIVPVAAKWLDRDALTFASRQDLREFFHYAVRTQIVTIGSLVTLETDSLIVGVARGPRQVGFYSVGAGFALQLRQVVLNGLGPIAAQLGRSFGERGLDAADEFEVLQRIWVVGVTAWCAAGLGSAYVAMTVWLGSGFGVTGVVATVLGLSNMINLWTGVTTSWLQVTGHPGVEARYGLLGVVVNIVLTGALVVPMGLYGIMIGTAVGQIFASVYLLRLIRQRVPFGIRSFMRDVPWASGLLTLGTTLVLEFGLRGFLPSGPPGLLLCGLLTIPGLLVFLSRERALTAALRLGLSRGEKAQASP